jgi:hypothetical protein
MDAKQVAVWSALTDTYVGKAQASPAEAWPRLLSWTPPRAGNITT